VDDVQEAGAVLLLRVGVGIGRKKVGCGDDLPRVGIFSIIVLLGS
jgi:hypothetical protein